MQFEWDEAKRAENIAKHRIDFADVSEMFDRPMLTEIDPRTELWGGSLDWDRFFAKRSRGCCLDRKAG